MTQRQAVLERLKAGELSQMQASRDLGVNRLAAVIFDLKRQGHMISSISREVESRYGKTRVAYYRLIEEAKQ